MNRLRSWRAAVVVALALCRTDGLAAQAVVTVVDLQASGTSPFAAGTEVVWTAHASGGVALQFQFWRYDNDGWHVVQPYGSSPTYRWTPAAADAGYHALQVWVRDAGSSAPYDAYLGVEFAVSAVGAPVVTGITANTSVVRAGGTTTWTAEVTGTSAALFYAWWRYDADGWHQVGAGPSFTWTPQAVDGGYHALQVWVGRVGVSVPYEAWASIEFVVEGSGLQVTLSPTPAMAQINTPLTWTATVTGTNEPVEFTFFRLDPDWGWRGVQAGLSNTFTWTPRDGDAGIHFLQVWVKRRTSPALYETYAGTDAWTVVPWIRLFPSVGTAPGAPAGSRLIYTADVQGMDGALEYQFWRLDADGWRIVQPYGPLTTYTWDQTPADNGTHALQLWVRRTTSTAAYDAWGGTGVFEVRR